MVVIGESKLKPYNSVTSIEGLEFYIRIPKKQNTSLVKQI